jgi:pimeloyl-ACP methyl ester carboxylesterase
MGLDPTTPAVPRRRHPAGVVGRTVLAGLLAIGAGLFAGHDATAQTGTTPPPSGRPAAAPTGAATAGITLTPVEDERFGFRAVVPNGWTEQGAGIYARASATGDPNDYTLLLLRSAPLPAEALWPQLESQLALSAPPSPIGTRETAVLRWELYHVDVPTPAGSIAVELGLAESDGHTWIVLLQADPTESAALRDAVFLPVIDAFAPLPTPTPSGEPAYGSLEVTFPGGAADVTLAGTLTVPRGPGPHPGIVLLTGSGPEDRDESIPPVRLKAFALIADALTRAGVAVLRFDDRGVGRSTGDYLSASLADLTQDAEAAVRYLRTRPEIDPDRVGVLGHSEGGIEVATMAAADPTLAFVVAVAGPAVPGVDLIVAQVEAIARASGQTEARVAALGQQERALLEAVRDGDDDKLRSLVAASIGQEWDAMTPEQRQQAGARDDYVRQSLPLRLAPLESPEFISIIRSDPGADWRTVAVPVLALYGGKDVQVPAEQSAPALAAALSTAARAPSTIVVLPDANHLFQPAVSGAPSEYATLPQEFTADFLPTIVDWVTAQVGVVEASAGT